MLLGTLSYLLMAQCRSIIRPSGHTAAYLQVRVMTHTTLYLKGGFLPPCSTRCNFLFFLSWLLQLLQKTNFQYLFSRVFLQYNSCCLNSVQMVFLNGPSPASFQLFFVFSNTYDNFYHKFMGKIQYTVLGLKLTTFRTWVSSNNH